MLGGASSLVLLTLINLFNYIDRYVLAALLPAIKRDMHLSDARLGFLATAFMLMYFVISPLFGWLGDHRPRNRVMAVGVAVWSLATAASGMAWSYASLIVARLGVGVGEAAYGSISPALISDLYPKSKRGRVFAIFFMAIPVGSALGYLLGGLLESRYGWRHAFFGVGVPGLVLALCLLFLQDPPRGAFDHEDEESKKTAQLPLPKIYAHLAKNKNYVLTVLGYCAYTFALGGIAVWIPSYMERYLNVSAAQGNILFGGVTVAAGFLATIVGGAWADAWARKGTDAYLKLSALSMFFAIPVYAIVLTLHSFTAFAVFLFVLEFSLFLSTSPVSAQIVNCVPVSMRATSNAVSIFMIHLLGDAVSPPLVGIISDHSELKTAMLIFFLAIFAAGVIWAAKVIFYFEALPWPEHGLKLPKSQCHRGFHLNGIQENTLAAFRAAKKAGATMVELDVRLSKDNIAVVIHDADIKRVTSGKAGFVKEMTAAELKVAASVPSLLEVLQDPEVTDFINVEIKSDYAGSNGLEAATARAVKEAKAERRILFSSFNPLVLRRISKLLPEVPRALLVTEENEPKNKIYLKKMLLAWLARPHMLNLRHSMYTEDFAAKLKGRGVPVSLWTVKTPESAKKLLAIGAESIISDSPDILRN